MPICAACRCTLLQNSRSVERQWHRVASYVSLAELPGLRGQATWRTTHSEEADSIDDNGDARHSRHVVAQQPVRSVEDDFLKRVLAGRNSSNSHGPYSRLRQPRQRSATPPELHIGSQDVQRTSPLSSLETSHPPEQTRQHKNDTPMTRAPDPLVSREYYDQRLSSQRSPSSEQDVSNSVRRGLEKNCVASRHDTEDAVIKHEVEEQLLPRVFVHDPATASEVSALDAGYPSLADPTQQKGSNLPGQQSTSRLISLPILVHEDAFGSNDIVSNVENKSTLPSSSIGKAKSSLCITNSVATDNAVVSDASTTRMQNSSNSSDIEPKVEPKSDHVEKTAGKYGGSVLSRTNNAKVSASWSVHLQQHVPPEPGTTENLERVILDSGSTMAESWENFLALQKLSAERRIPLSRKLRVALFKKMIASWSQDHKSPVILTPSAALKRLFKVTPNDMPLWAIAIWSVLLNAVRCLRSDTFAYSGVPNQALHREIISLWDICLQSTTKHRREMSNGVGQVQMSAEWDVLVESEQMKQIRLWFTKSFQPRLCAFFPIITGKMIKDFDSVALISFAILEAQVDAFKKDGHDEAQPNSFQRFIAHLLPYSDLKAQIERHTTAMIEHGASPEDITLVRNLLEHIAARAVTLHIGRDGSHSNNDTDNIPRSDSISQHVQLEELFKRRIARAIESEHLVRLESIWGEACTAYEPKRHSTAETGIPASLFGFFLTAFMALRRPNRAVDVWNIMMNSGVQPTVAHWDAMLKGCGISKDADALHDVWNKMLASGIKPDVQVWTTRIHAASVSGQWRYGIEAFRDMTRLWLEEVNKSQKTLATIDFSTIGDVNGVPKPNTQTLNSVVVGLSRRHRQDELVSVLKLAQSLGIIPDSYTFNPLIRTAIQSGNNTLALKLLTQMQQLGIQPDVATFTMMLQSLFRGSLDTHIEDVSDQMSAREQAASEILRDMHRHGLQSNAWTFATLINGLLKSSDAGNITAAYAVVNHMTANKIAMSSQIFTALLTYHFNQRPADLGAIEALWNRARMEPGLFLDVVFYDRLIEGFARCGETGRMMAALAHAGKRGKTPGWTAMMEVVSALVRAGDYARAEEIVISVRNEDTIHDGIRQNKGKANFWRLVHELGLQRVLEPEPAHTIASEDVPNDTGSRHAHDDVASTRSFVEALN